MSTSTGAQRRQQILDAGGVRQLIGMLSNVSLSGAVIARKMAELVSKVVGQAETESKGKAEGDAAPAEPGQLAKQKSSGKSMSVGGPVEEEVMGVQEQAAATLSDLAFGDAAMQREIIEGGGVPPLIALLRSGSVVSQEHAARAIWTLSMTVANHSIVMDSGAVPELIALCKGGSENGKGYAAAVISELGKGAIAARQAAVDSSSASKEGKDEGESLPGEEQLAQCAAAIHALVAIASTGQPMAKEHAVGALSILSQVGVHRDAVSKAGGIPPIVQLLEDSTSEAQDKVVAALARLAEGQPENQSQIAKKLVSLLALNNEGAQRRAAHSLSRLANNHEGAPVRIVNAGAISPLVALLGHGPANARDEAVGVLACLAQNNSQNQLAIATGLVALQGLAPEDSKDHLSRMVQEFTDATDLSSAIARAAAFARGDEGDGAGAQKFATVFGA